MPKTGKSRELTRVDQLTLDPQNARQRTARGRDMIVRSLRDLRAGRSIVIDEQNVILAGNGVADAAAEAGIDRLRIIDTDGDELIAIRRSNLTPDQKRQLAIFDNRTNELSTWVIPQFQADLDAGRDLTPFFTTDELDALFRQSVDSLPQGSSQGTSSTLAERFGVPPFSVLDARQGYWQDRKRAWLSLGIQSELGRGGALTGQSGETAAFNDHGKRSRANATPAGAMMPAANYSKTRARGDGRGRAVKA